MAGWADSGSSRGRRGGGGFANRGVNNMNTRWRERRPAPHLQQDHQHQQPHHPQHQQPQQQHPQHQQQHQQQQQHRQQHRYRPVNDNDQSSQHLHHSPAEEPNRQQGQGAFSTSAHRPQPTRPPQPSPTFTDHKSSAPAANANSNANEPDDKARRNAANFECNVCFDMADDPVVTKCGHLFCWECLYQWLHVHSHHRECPVCKGQVADDAIIPIYGRGGSAASVHAAPPRPTGARVESSRQQLLQQAAVDWHMVDDDEDDSPIDALRHLAFGSSMTLLSSIMPEFHTSIGGYDSYINPYHNHDFDDVYFDESDFPAFGSAGAGSSRGHGHHTADSDETMDSFVNNTNEVLDFLYGGGRRQSGRARGARYADRSSMVMGGSSSSASYRDTGAGPPRNNNNINNTGASSRPNGGWTERRGRSNRNSNPGGGGRGMQNNSRRQGANYNRYGLADSGDQIN